MKPSELRKLRAQMGWSREKLARELVVSSRTIYRWERGEHPMRPVFADAIRRLAKKAREEKAA